MSAEPLLPLATFLYLALCPHQLTCMDCITGHVCPLANGNNGKYDQGMRRREKRG